MFNREQVNAIGIGIFQVPSTSWEGLLVEQSHCKPLKPATTAIVIAEPATGKELMLL